MQGKGPVAYWGLGLKRTVLGGRIFSHCWRHPSRPATSPSPPMPAATLRGRPASHMRALSSSIVIKGKDIFGRKVPSVPWESPVAGWTTGYPRGSQRQGPSPYPQHNAARLSHAAAAGLWGPQTSYHPGPCLLACLQEASATSLLVNSKSRSTCLEPRPSPL